MTISHAFRQTYTPALLADPWRISADGMHAKLEFYSCRAATKDLCRKNLRLSALAYLVLF
jgi:hypothetical protein